MLKIEFDPANKKLAMALGVALVQYGSDDVKLPDEVSYTGDFKADAESLAAGYGGKSTTACDDQDGADHSNKTAPLSEATDEYKNTAKVEPVDTDAPVDKHGVAHSGKYCVGLKAKEPFYQSGPNKGQWKRGKGVDESAYNEWYASALPESALPEEEEHDTPVNSSAAFGAKQEKPAETFSSIGDFMGWVSEKQKAGVLTNNDLQEAYQNTGTVLDDLFNPEKAGEALSKVSNYLLLKVKA